MAPRLNINGALKHKLVKEKLIAILRLKKSPKSADEERLSSPPSLQQEGDGICPEVRALVAGIIHRIIEKDAAEQRAAAKAHRRAAVKSRIKSAVDKFTWKMFRHTTGDSAAAADCGDSGDVCVLVSVAPAESNATTSAKASVASGPGAADHDVKLLMLAARMRDTLKSLFACGAAKLPVG